MSVKNTQFNTKDSYNSQYVSGKYVGYNSQQLSDATPSAPQVNSATGGVIAEYTSGSDVYRSHTFLASGSLVVSQLSDDPTVPHEADILVVGGGGAGGHGQPGSYETGGGGAGGFRTLTGFTLGAGDTYPVVIGAGGVSYSPGGSGTNANGGDSTWNMPGSEGTTKLTSSGGGGGGGGSPGDGGDGGSGGGNRRSSTIGEGNSPPVAPPQGNDGGELQGPGNWAGGGGGGAGAVGGNGTYPPSTGGAGGIGVQNDYATGSSIYYAGGGGGGTFDTVGGAGGNGGGGAGARVPGTSPPYPGRGENGTSNLGGGGGGGPASDYPMAGGQGGSGTVIVRYKIGEIGGTAKATGGNISFWENPGSPTGNTCVHTFLYPGTFVAPAPIADLEYVIVAGGGGGGAASDNGYGGGGGGAGQYVTGSTPSFAANPYPIVIGAGGAGGSREGGQSAEPWQNGNPSSFNSITCGGGGGGGVDVSPFSGLDGVAGSPAGKGSGGGQTGKNNAPAGAGTGGPGGYPGGAKPYPPGPGNCNAGSGGGGAGGAGQPASQCADPVVIGAKGGVGVQLPATFRDPVSTVGGPGPGSNFWVAGGGAGGAFWPGTAGAAAEGAGGGGIDGAAPFGTSSPYAGGGAGGFGNPVLGTLCNGKSGWANTGGGGGGAGTKNPGSGIGGQGGSGIVLIAYPI